MNFEKEIGSAYNIKDAERIVSDMREAIAGDLSGHLSTMSIECMNSFVRNAVLPHVATTGEKFVMPPEVQLFFSRAGIDANTGDRYDSEAMADVDIGDLLDADLLPAITTIQRSVNRWNDKYAEDHVCARRRDDLSIVYEHKRNRVYTSKKKGEAVSGDELKERISATLMKTVARLAMEGVENISVMSAYAEFMKDVE